MIYRCVRWAYGLAEAVWMEHHPAATTPVACEKLHPRLLGAQGESPARPLGRGRAGRHADEPREQL